jgi:pantetheine-phosphate adenylyltransferase
MVKFKTVAVGGTFDQLHRGHKALLKKAFETGEKVLIGLCTDEFVEKMKKPHAVAPYDQRLEDLRIFLLINGWLDRAEIVPLNNAYGVLLSKAPVEGLIVSRETQPMGTQINRRRKERSLPPLKIAAINMIPSENKAPISTTRIRQGEIDRDGHILMKKGNT